MTKQTIFKLFYSLIFYGISCFQVQAETLAHNELERYLPFQAQALLDSAERRLLVFQLNQQEWLSPAGLPSFPKVPPELPESEHSASSILYDTTLDYPEAQPSDRPTLLLDQQYHSLLAQIQPIQTHLVNQEKKIRAQLKHEQELALSLGDESELSEEELMNAYDEITDRGNSQITKNLHFQRQLKGIENSLALYLSYRQKAKLKQRPRTCKPRLYLQAALLDSDLSIYLYGRIENPPETCGLSAVRPKAVIVAMGKNPSNKPSSAVQWQADRFIIHQELDSEHLPFNAVDMTSGEIPDSDEMSKPTLIQIKSCLSGKDCLVSNSQELHHFSIEVIAGFQ